MRFLLIAALSLVVSSCANTGKISNTWLAPDLLTKNPSGTVVVAIADNDNIKLLFENKFVAELKNHGARAAASNSINKKFLKIEDVIAFAKTEKLDTVLVVNYVGDTGGERYNPGTVYYGIHPGYGDLDGYYGYVYEFASTPAYYTVHKNLRISATLYEISTKEILWNATSSVLQGNSVETTINSYITSFVKQLQKDKLIK